jgi:hypothetical protein
MAAARIAAGQGVMAGHVTLPVDEYNRLIELASKPAKKGEAPPVPYTLQSAELKLAVEGETVAGTVDLRGEVLFQGALKAPLVTGMTIVDATRSGGPLPLVQEGGTHSAVLAGPSEFTISLRAGLPLAIEAGRAAFTVQAPAASAVRMTLTVPGEFTQVAVTPGLITERASNGGKTIVQATLVPGKPATVSWASRMAAVQAAPPKEARFLSDVKTLITVGEAEIAMSSLAAVTVVQGEPQEFALEIPAGYEITGATGATLAASEVRGQSVALKVAGDGPSHEFLISMVKASVGAKAELALPGFHASQRETGEVLIEGEGTMELAAAEHGGLRRMDVKEGSAQLRALAKHGVHASFRYMKHAGEAPALAMEWTRFPDTPVAAAVAERAQVTTLVTTEGRSLTEVKMTVRNQSQQFLKVALPAGAQILSADVAGVKVKPLTGADGDRVPLLRQGFRPAGPYQVSFVFLHSGAPFAKKGGSELGLPKMDVPVGLVTWEVFLPKQYRVSDFGGDAVKAELMPVVADDEAVAVAVTGIPGGVRQFAPPRALVPAPAPPPFLALAAGQLGGHIVDASGGGVPRAEVMVTHAQGTRRATTDSSGRWLVMGIPTGSVKIAVAAPGFKNEVRSVEFNASLPVPESFRMQVGAINETIEVTSKDGAKQSAQIEREARQNAAAQRVEPSANVTALQNRVAGVLPIAVNVPHAGNSYRFVRPLVVDEETRVTFSYRMGK